MLDALYGEFLIIPIPVQLKGSYCSHGCPYCYANLNLPTRKIDLRKTLNQIAGIYKNENLLSYLLRDQYPVLVSNHSDPFSLSNRGVLPRLIEQMGEMEIPVFIQTRGGDEDAIASVLNTLPSSVWYISMPHSNDRTRQEIEPIAPSYESRVELIKELSSKGHGVIVGINPLVPEWMEDRDKMLREIKELGIKDLAIEIMHLSRNQKENMKRHEKIRLGDRQWKSS